MLILAAPTSTIQIRFCRCDWHDVKGMTPAKRSSLIKGFAMKIRNKSLLAVFLLAYLTVSAAQKIKTGSDDTVDFTQYKTYTWLKPPKPPTRPYLYSVVVGTIDEELKKRGLTRVDDGGDLYIAPSGGIGVDLNTPSGAPMLPIYGSMATYNYNMWVGNMPAASTTRAVAQGSLVLQFVDAKQNHVVWSGMVADKLDFEQKKDSLDRMEKAIRKLLKEYPPKKKK